MKQNILILCDHPLGTSGNAGMAHSILNQIPKDDYNICLGAIHGYAIDQTNFSFEPLPCQVIPFSPKSNDIPQFLANFDFHFLLIVGHDVWLYNSIIKNIKYVCEQKGTKIIWLFPYELQNIRKDMVEWINMIDYPLVYSEYGYNRLKSVVPRLKYFRPPLHYQDTRKQYSAEKKATLRKKHFPKLSPETKLIGFVGKNQIRKEPLKVISAVSKLIEQNVDVALYLHTNLEGTYNLTSYVADCENIKSKVFRNDPNSPCPPVTMTELYNCFDVLVLPSMQEGLSWTPLEAMLCGCPTVLSNSSAHIELGEGGASVLVPCKTPAVLPIESSLGMTHIETKCCTVEDIVAAINIAINPENKDILIKNGLERAKEWCENTHNVVDVLKQAKQDALREIKATSVGGKKKQAVLFIQHSAAGDVFMTTRCLKGIKNRYSGMALHYMTMSQYAGLLKGNPYIDKIIEWDNNLVKSAKQIYQYVLNPHGERILPGHWGRNCNSILSDFYWKILKVEPDVFYISLVRPQSNQKTNLNLFMKLLDTNSNLQYTVVHTTGGDTHFRTYKYMADVCDGLRDKGIITIQLGGKNDYPAGADYDFRGILSYQESAWLMSKACAAVTVDSFMSHLAGALGISQVCLFGSGNENVVKPKQMSGKLICFSPDYVMDCKGLGPCSATVRDCPVPCTGYHNPKDILKALELIL